MEAEAAVFVNCASAFSMKQPLPAFATLVQNHTFNYRLDVFATSWLRCF